MNLKSSSLLWKDLCISPYELRLNTLKCGQSFRWKYINDYWASTLNGSLVVLKETPESILYGYNNKEIPLKEKEIRDYFQLDRVSLKDCYERWSKVDTNFAKKCVGFQGIRMLRQDPWENLISFICSSNNNISRISLMIQRFCERFGNPLPFTLDDQTYYDFPSLKDIKEDAVEIEKILRDLGFGYRAKYIAKTIEALQSEPLGQDYLTTLRNVPYLEAKDVLVKKFQGVGPKVADCVCLMSLDHSESIPVDTHVWQIALRDYGFKKGSKQIKTLNAKLYLEVGDHFRLLFGDYSGWAHSVLFTADLKNFDKKRKQEEEIIQIVKKREKLDYY